ncbi:hypothetical protein DWB79_01955 [Treponema medium]|uniref:Uncharacterized protein n=2 Tax=Treponema medium TaxID=58231 RepID=A0AA87NRP8_TREMD|nr:hypothetical protein [Treponema medium]EPF29683.1 hypothetical protein HMPREF9195_00387 [Treponema medium ATCC 700293]QSH96545.1 hypothetical protein DWB79_01955 [Treponema medium]
MVIKINGEELSYTLENEKTLGEVLGSIEEACCREHETIVQVAVDGKELSSHELDLLFKQPVDTDITIELSTFSGAEIRNYMKGLTQELSQYVEDFEQIPVYMQTGKDVQVLNLLGTFSEKLKELYRSLLLSDVTELPIDIQIEDKSVHEYQKEITALLHDIVTSIEEKDIIQVGDLAEYELAPLVKTLINGVSSTLN